MKANTSYIIQGNIVRFPFPGQPDLTIDWTKIHSDVREEMGKRYLGEVRARDKAAVERADKDGNIRPESVRNKMKYERMAAVLKHLESGTSAWRMGGTVKVVQDHSITLAAICEVFKTTLQLANEKIDLWAKSQNVSRTAVLDSFAARKDVSEIIQRMKAEATKDVDLDGLLKDFAQGTQE